MSQQQAHKRPQEKSKGKGKAEGFTCQFCEGPVPHLLKKCPVVNKSRGSAKACLKKMKAWHANALGIELLEKYLAEQSKKVNLKAQEEPQNQEALQQEGLLDAGGWRWDHKSSVEQENASLKTQVAELNAKYVPHLSRSPCLADAWRQTC